MAQGRVQVQDLQSDIRLKPAPIQSDTYAPPPQLVRNDNALRLADALGSFSNSIGSLQGVIGRKSAADREKEGWAMTQKYAGWSPQQWNEAVVGGKVPGGTTTEAMAINAMAGDGVAMYQTEQLKQRLMTTTDWNSTDVVGEVRQQMADTVKQYGADPNFGKPYMRRMESFLGSIDNLHQQREIDQFNQTKKDASFQWIDTKIDTMVSSGTKPEDIAKSIPGWYKDLGKDGSLGMSYEDLDKEVYNKAMRLAGSGNAEEAKAALAIMEVNLHKGRNGQDISIATSPEYRDEYLRVVGVAQKVIGKQAVKDTMDGIASGNVQLLREGRLDSVKDFNYTDENGTEKVLTRKDQMDQAEQLYLKQSRSEQTANREDDDQRQRREFIHMRDNGLTHPDLKTAVTGVADMASPNLVNDAVGMEKLKDKVRKSQWMLAESPNSYMAYADPDSQKFVQTYIQAKSYLRNGDNSAYTDDQALQFAIKANNKAPGAGLAKLDLDTINREVDKVTPRTFFGLMGGEEPRNWSSVQRQMTDLASSYVAAGVEPGKAVTMASKAVKDTSITYRGETLNMQGMAIPENFPKVMDGFLDDLAKKNPEMLARAGIDASQLSIEPVGSGTVNSGRFYVVDGDGIPALTKDGNQIYFSLDQVRQFGNHMATQEHAADARDRNLRETAKQRGYSFSTVPGQEDVWVTKSGEIVEPTYKDGSLVPEWKKTGKRQKQLVERPDQFR